MRWLITLAVPTVLFASACNSTPAPTPSATASPTATAAVAAATGSTGAAATPTRPPAVRVNGTVQTIASGKVTMSDGTSFTLAATSRVVRQTVGTAADLKKGQFVAVTAKRQPDNTLLASIVSVFPASLANIPPGQRPLPEGNLMTNATIDTIDGNKFTVAFTGGGANVTVAPDAQVLLQTDVTAADIKVGQKISASVAEGVAQSVTLN